jgi:hypothetical protein
MNYQLDSSFWRFVVYGLAVFSLVFLWLKTAKTPLYWTAIILLHIEAGLRRLWKSACLMGRDFKNGYGDDVQGVAADVLGYSESRLAVSEDRSYLDK